MGRGGAGLVWFFLGMGVYLLGLLRGSEEFEMIPIFFFGCEAALWFPVTCFRILSLPLNLHEMREGKDGLRTD